MCHGVSWIKSLVTLKNAFIAGIKVAAPTNGNAGPTSQIPGLSQSATESTPTERSTGRRVGIFATDSEYVKLAKAGGQKGEEEEQGGKVWRGPGLTNQT